MRLIKMQVTIYKGGLADAEIHQFFHDGAMSVHTRSRKVNKKLVPLSKKKYSMERWKGAFWWRCRRT